jgi:hypothetical protein
VRLIHERSCLYVPKTSSASCDRAIFVDQATGASAFSYAVLVEVDKLRQWFQRGGCVQGAVRPVQIVMGLVLAQDPPQMIPVPDEGTVQELAAASPDPAFSDRVHPRRPDVAAHGRRGSRRHMISDHYGRVTGIATSLLTATDGILGTHRWLLHIVAYSRPVLGVSLYERTGHICRLCAGNVLSNP